MHGKDTVFGGISVVSGAGFEERGLSGRSHRSDVTFERRLKTSVLAPRTSHLTPSTVPPFPRLPAAPPHRRGRPPRARPECHADGPPQPAPPPPPAGSSAPGPPDHY